MVQISIKMDNRQVTRRINSLGAGISNFKKPFEQVGDDLIEFYGDDVFKTQGRALGERWKPLSASTLRARAMGSGHYSNPPAGSRNKILMWTERLKKGFVKTVTKRKLVIGNKVPYFKHNQGKRKMLGINRKVIKIVTSGITKYLNSLIKK